MENNINVGTNDPDMFYKGFYLLWKDFMKSMEILKPVINGTYEKEKNDFLTISNDTTIRAINIKNVIIRSKVWNAQLNCDDMANIIIQHIDKIVPPQVRNAMLQIIENSAVAPNIDVFHNQLNEILKEFGISFDFKEFFNIVIRTGKHFSHLTNTDCRILSHILNYDSNVTFVKEIAKPLQKSPQKLPQEPPAESPQESSNCFDKYASEILRAKFLIVFNEFGEGALGNVISIINEIDDSVISPEEKKLLKDTFRNMNPNREYYAFYFKSQEEKDKLQGAIEKLIKKLKQKKLSSTL